ncbi:polyol transporter 5-like [Chenopodium quinoa]|uniref:polyol transporter 5-like n=1 Tax=Chenopodium quinoa TaxID=63459 RepID=UPI000B778BC1|nr:polyol transporter 5-like [Chenopodium quinoa]
MEEIEVGNHSKTKEVIVKPKVKMNKYALACALLASTNSILLGYDIGVISGAILYIREDLKLSKFQEEILVGSLNVCSLIGSLLSGKTSDLIGRRYTIVLAACTFFAGALLMGLAPSYPYLMAGRVVAGIGVGYSLMIAPVYTAEISPTMTRGFMSSLPEVFITVGILLGYVVNYALSGIPNNWNWRVMLLLAVVPSIGVGLGVFFMPESPRWLVMKKRLSEAKTVLVATSENEEEAEVRLGEITRAWELHEASNFVGQSVWKELLWKPTPGTRRILIAAIGINFFMQASGNDAVIYYLPEVFSAAGIKKKKLLFAINVIMGTAKATFVMISALVLDKYGRRPLLLLSSAGMAVSLSTLGLGSMFLRASGHKPSWAIVVSVIAVCADVSFFSVGLGPITWVYSSEIFPMRLRAQGTSLAVSVNRFVSGVVAMTFLTIATKITFGGMFFVLAGIMVLAMVFFFFTIPETKGKNLEDIGKLFENKKTSDEGREIREA